MISNLIRGWCGHTAAVLFGLSVATSASADMIEDYFFSGSVPTSLSTGDSVIGTFSIDFTDQSVTAFDLSTPIGEVSEANDYIAGLNTFPSGLGNQMITSVVFIYVPKTGGGMVSLQLFFASTLAAFSTNASTPLAVVFDVEGGGTGYSLFECNTPLICASSVNSDFTGGKAENLGPEVPEPASIAILGTGLAGLGIVRRRTAS